MNWAKKKEVYRSGKPLFRTIDYQLLAQCQRQMMMIVVKHNVAFKAFVVWGGIEPPTHGFSVHCSTN